MPKTEAIDLIARIKWLEAELDLMRVRQLIFTLPDPAAQQANDNEFYIKFAVTRDITISKLEIGLDAAGNEVLGDLMWADDFITQANATVINAFDTTSGVRVDTSITAGSVAAGKCLFLRWDSQPSSDIKQMHVTIYFTYD